MTTETAQKEDLGGLDALYDDPLRPATARAGKTLVIVSVIAISVALFGARLSPTPLIPLTFDDQPTILPSLLMAVLILLLLNFGLKAWTDWLRDKEVRLHITRLIEKLRATAAMDEARRIDYEMYGDGYNEEQGSEDIEPWHEEAYEIKAAAELRVHEIEKSLGLRNLPRLLRMTRVFLEIAVPLALGIVGTILLAGQV